MIKSWLDAAWEDFEYWMKHYAEKLCRHGVPFECHIFPQGGYGAPWCDDTIWAKSARRRDYNYICLPVEWLRELFGLLQVVELGQSSGDA